MPRFPMIRVMGSKAKSTSSRGFSAGRLSSAGRLIWRTMSILGVTLGPPRLGTAGQHWTVVAPLGFFVGAPVRDGAHGPDEGSVDAHDPGGQRRAGRLVHERHELVRKAGHCAGNADAADVGAAANAVHPAALG